METYFYSITALVGIIIPVTEWLNKTLNLSALLSRITSWVTSIALCYLGWTFQLGVFVGISTWYTPAIYGLAIGLISNGIFTLDMVKSFLAILKLRTETPVTNSTTVTK